MKSRPTVLYILNGHEPVPATDIVEWARWFETADRIVRVTELPVQGGRLSTVFLGSDHGFGTGRPILFETALINAAGEFDILSRYSTWAEAEAGHEKFVAHLAGGGG